MKFTIPLGIPTPSGSNIITVGTPCRITISVGTMAAAKWVKQRSSQGLRARALHVITGWRIFAAEKNGSASTEIFISFVWPRLRTLTSELRTSKALATYFLWIHL